MAVRGTVLYHAIMHIRKMGKIKDTLFFHYDKKMQNNENN